jgi:hypothetical protein
MGIDVHYNAHNELYGIFSFFSLDLQCHNLQQIQ